MRQQFTRRALLATALSSVATSVLANAPLTSLRPVARAGAAPADPEAGLESMAEIIAGANLGGTVGCAVADLATGQILEVNEPYAGLPPASVTKAVTALFALDALGPEFTFTTELRGTGPIENGVLQGDLILVGGGDPNLVTDQLATLVDGMVDAGVTKIAGSFYVWDKALPYREEIDPPQLDHLGYNPSVSGLNLNFNRVHFEWRRANGKYTVAMDARSATRKPDVYTSRMRIVDRSLPVYTYAQVDSVDEWTVARGALGTEGSRWLPVRNPAYYAADVFQTLARARGVPLPTPQKITELPDSEAVATFSSAPMIDVLRDMLKFSTNITAEGVGLTATRQILGRTLPLEGSANCMNRWAASKGDLTTGFEDHSGLSDDSAIAAQDMVALLSSEGAMAALRPILKEHVMTDQNARRIDGFPADVRAKTGTLNFVSSLAGYIRTKSETDLVFAIFTANLTKREAGKASGDEVPNGAPQWNRQSKRLQQRLVQRWAKRYDTVDPLPVIPDPTDTLPNEPTATPAVDIDLPEEAELAVPTVAPPG